MKKTKKQLEQRIEELEHQNDELGETIMEQHILILNLEQQIEGNRIYSYGFIIQKPDMYVYNYTTRY